MVIISPFEVSMFQFHNSSLRLFPFKWIWTNIKKVQTCIIKIIALHAEHIWQLYFKSTFWALLFRNESFLDKLVVTLTVKTWKHTEPYVNVFLFSFFCILYINMSYDDVLLYKSIQLGLYFVLFCLNRLLIILSISIMFLKPWQHYFLLF